MTSEHNYGIKSLTTSAADGGTITTSGNYRIHTFTSTGTFTVNKPMNVEVLVVAGGGGGGGGAGGGGGGAGGLLYNNVSNVGIGTKAVTIGSGGVGGIGASLMTVDATLYQLGSGNVNYVQVGNSHIIATTQVNATVSIDITSNGYDAGGAYRIDGGTWVDIGTTVNSPYYPTFVTRTVSASVVSGQKIEFGIKNAHSDVVDAQTYCELSKTTFAQYGASHVVMFTQANAVISAQVLGTYDWGYSAYRINGGVWVGIGGYEAPFFSPTQSVTASIVKGQTIEFGVRAGGQGGVGQGEGCIRNTMVSEPALTYGKNTGITDGIAGSSGQNSVFSTMTAFGGGRGASPGVVAASGGSGGGGGYNSVAPGSGTSGQGYAGGNASATTPYPTGGGGGAGAVGANYLGTQSGAGGVGLSSSITGSAVNYAGGGGGSYSTQGALAGAGGTGGGGAGGASSGAAGGNGNANTGGGGGGSSNGAGGTGGSGIVIIRYLSSYDVTAASMTVSPPSESPCRAGICTVGVSVTWTNNNTGSTSLSDLSITVSNGTSTISPLSYPSESFTANQTKGPYTFTVLNMIAGTHSICPNPN